MTTPKDEMVMTILEARVAANEWAALEGTYRAHSSAGLPAGLVETFLIQSTSEPAVWRIVSIWESSGALMRMRNSGETPGGVLIFRAAGVEPELTVHKVLHTLHR